MAPMTDPIRPTEWKAVHVQRVVLPQVVEETADEGPDDAEHDGAEDADRVAAWEKKAGQQRPRSVR